MTNLFKRFAKDESGATAIEYGLIAAIMAVALIAAFQILTPALNNAFTGIGNTLNAANGGGGG